MLKKFRKKSEFKRNSVAKDIENGIKEQNERALREKKNKRVVKYNKRFQ